MAVFLLLLTCNLSLLPLNILLDSDGEIYHEDHKLIQDKFCKADHLSTILNAKPTNSCETKRYSRAPIRRWAFLLQEERIKEATIPNQIEKFRVATLDCIITANTNLPRNLLEVWVGRYHPHLSLPC